MPEYRRSWSKVPTTVDHLGGLITITLGYQHPALNKAVKGKVSSQHIVGRGHDITADDITPLELAQAALTAIGCQVGIGLRQNIIHVDMRGRLTSWSYPGAELTEPESVAWVKAQWGL